MDDAAALALPASSGPLDEQSALLTVPSLQELCVSYIARHLHLFPSLSSLPYHLAELVVSRAPLLALQLVINCVDSHTRQSQVERHWQIC
jgi:hypothetical protein